MEDQRAFAEKYEVPYPMLCDTEKVMAKAYGVLGGSHATRASFLIDKEGVVRKVWPKVTPASHPAEVIQALKSL